MLRVWEEEGRTWSEGNIICNLLVYAAQFHLADFMKIYWWQQTIFLSDLSDLLRMIVLIIQVTQLKSELGEYNCEYERLMAELKALDPIKNE